MGWQSTGYNSIELELVLRLGLGPGLGYPWGRDDCKPIDVGSVIVSTIQSNPSLFQALSPKNSKKLLIIIKKEVCSYTVRRLYNIESVTSDANVQNVVQCYFHMRESDIENYFYIYQ